MSSSQNILIRYDYDPLDRLAANESPNEPKSQRFYCKSRLATEIQGAMQHSIVQHGDQLLAQVQNDGTARDTALLATDQQRSVLQTLKGNQPPNPIAYAPHGHHPAINGLLSLLGFNGERPDPVTGCYLLGNGYRAFNPTLMRFNSPDSLSPFGKGGLNIYTYCFGDPINWNDQTGKSPLLKSLMKFTETKINEAHNFVLRNIANAAPNIADQIDINTVVKSLEKAKNKLTPNKLVKYSIDPEKLQRKLFNKAEDHLSQKRFERSHDVLKAAFDGKRTFALNAARKKSLKKSDLLKEYNYAISNSQIANVNQTVRLAPPSYHSVPPPLYNEVTSQADNPALTAANIRENQS
jgi:RHS repeat-associated protein